MEARGDKGRKGEVREASKRDMEKGKHSGGKAEIKKEREK